MRHQRRRVRLQSLLKYLPPREISHLQVPTCTECRVNEVLIQVCIDEMQRINFSLWQGEKIDFLSEVKIG